jgi:hypothetical protein
MLKILVKTVVPNYSRCQNYLEELLQEIYLLLCSRPRADRNWRSGVYRKRIEDHQSEEE